MIQDEILITENEVVEVNKYYGKRIHNFMAI